MMIVYAYPFFYALDTFLKSLAAAHGAQSSEQIMAECHPDSTEIHWAILEDYLRQITGTYCHGIVALPQEMHDANQYTGTCATYLDYSAHNPSVALQDMMF